MSSRVFLFLIGVALFAGCADNLAPQSETVEEKPTSYAEMVSQIKSQATTIETAFTSGKPDDAHHSLHEIGNLLLGLPDVAKKSSFGESDLNDVHAATKSLLDAFGKLDAVMHKSDSDISEDTTYEDVASDVTAGIETLDSKSELPGADVAQTDAHAHDHDGEDHAHDHDDEEHAHDHDDAQAHDGEDHEHDHDSHDGEEGEDHDAGHDSHADEVGH